MEMGREGIGAPRVGGGERRFQGGVGRKFERIYTASHGHGAS